MSVATQAIQRLIDAERGPLGDKRAANILEVALDAVREAEAPKPYPPAKGWSGSSDLKVRYEG